MIRAHFGLDQNQLFIVMEYVPGKDLKTLLRQRGPSVCGLSQ